MAMREKGDESAVDTPVPDSFGLDAPSDEWMDRLRAAETPSSLGCIGPYELIAEVSRGGQGIVYRARQPGTNREIAVKRMLAGSFATPAVRRRFEREVELAAGLNHPNLVTVFGLEVVDGQPLLAMEWIDGVPVDEWSAGEGGTRRSPREVARLMQIVCEGVRHAHQRGIIHRDLKPSNILVDHNDSPHVLDFGLARSIDPSSGQSAITLTDQFVGTPAFAAPEQLRGGPDAIDVRSDVYSLGVVLFNALTGSMPYKVSGDLPEVFRNIEQAEPVRPSSICVSVDREIESVVLKALSKDKDRRYQTVDAMAEDLRRYVEGEPILAHPPSTFYHVRKLVKRHRLPFALAAVVFGVMLAFAITATYQAQRIRLERDQSRLDAAKAEAVSEFLRTMFASANPEQSGHDVRVVDVLERAKTKIDSGFDEQPEVRVVLHSTLGETYFGLGLYDEADQSYQAALRAGTTSLGEDHELTLDAMSSLGVIRSARNKLVEAEGFSRGAYEGFSRTLGREASQTLVAANNLAGFLRRVNRLDESEQLYRETYEIRLRTLGDADLDTLASMNNLSMMLMFRGKLTEAEPVVLEALRGCRRIFGESHPKTLLVTNNYAKLLHRLGRLEEAASRYREILAVRRQTLTPNHPDIMLSLNNLGMVLKEQNKIDQARGILTEVVDVYYGDDPPAQPAHWGSRGKDLFSHHVLFQLADIYANLENVDAVDRLFQRALSRTEDFQDDDRWRVGIVRREYGLCLSKLGRKADAREQLRDALEVLRHSLDSDDPRTREIHEDLRTLDDPGGDSPHP